MVMVGFEGPELTPSDEEFIGRYEIGNVIFLGRNIIDPAQAESLTHRLQEIASHRRDVYKRQLMSSPAGSGRGSP